MADARKLAYVLSLKDDSKDAADSAEKTLEKLNGAFLKIPTGAIAAGGAIVGVGAAVVELTKQAFDLGNEFDGAWDKIRIGTGATGARFENMQADIRGALADIPTDIDKASTAIVTLNQRLGEGGPERKQLAEDILQLSRLTGTDLQENLKNSSAMFRSWNVDAEDQSETLNKLLRAYQATGTSVITLGSTVTELGPIFRTLGLGLTESIALTGALEREGVSTEVVMRGLNTTIGKLAAAGIDAAEALPDIIASIRDMESPVDAVGLAVELFGSRAGPKLAEAIRAGRLEITDLVGDIDTGTETIAGLASDTDDAAEKMQIAWNKAKDAAEPVAAGVFDIATAITTGLVPAIDNAAPKVKAFFEDMAKAMRGDLNKGDVFGGIMGALNQGVGEASGINIGALLAKAGETADAAGRALPGADEAERVRVADENWRTWAAAQEAAALAALAEVDAVVDDAVAKTTPPKTSGGTAHDAAWWRAQLGLDKGGAAATAAQQGAESAIDGFMAGMSANRANLTDRFGDLGTAAASAMAVAFAENTKSSGAAVFREVENIILKLQKEGVENWRELGDQMAGVFHDGLIKGIDGGMDLVSAELDRVTAILKAHRALTPENLLASIDEATNAQSLGSGGSSIMESLAKSIDEGGEQNRQALARQAVSWIAEVRNGLSPERAAAVIADFTGRLVTATEDTGPEARAALEDIFRATRFEIPMAAIEQTLADAETRILKTQVDARMALEATRDIADAAKMQKDALSGDQASRMAALLATFPDSGAQNAEKAAKAIADAQLKGTEAVNAAHFAGDSRAVTAAMLAAEKQIKALQDQAKEQDAQVDKRKIQEQAVAALREQFVRENDALSATLAQEAYARSIDQINTHAAADLAAAQTKFDQDVARLNETLGIVQAITAASDAMFDGALDDINGVVAQATSLAAALAITVPGGLGAATPVPGTAFDASGSLRSLTIGNLNVNNSGYIGEGGAEALMAEAVAAEEALIQ